MLGDPIGIFLPPCQISEKLVKKRTLQLVRTIRRFLVSNRLFPLYIDVTSSHVKFLSLLRRVLHGRQILAYRDMVPIRFFEDNSKSEGFRA